MKNCVLYISPNGKIPYIHETFKDSDVYYVTYLRECAGSIGFNKGANWIYNRNDLAKKIEKKYEYYIFMDYDVVFDCGDTERKINEYLQEYYPAIMTPINAKKEKMVKGKIENNPLTNNHVKIIHHSLVDYFFPMLDRFGGFWDGAIFFATLATAFRSNIIHVHDIPCRGMVSANYAHNKNALVGKTAMDNLFNWIKPSLGERLQYASRGELEKNETKHFGEIIKSPKDVIYTFDKRYVDITHDIFSYRNAK